MGNSLKWAAPALVLMTTVAFGIGAMNDSCVETKYSGGRLIECESTTIFQPLDERVGVRGEEAAPAGVASIPLPPSVMGFLGVMLHRGCETAKVPEGDWTVCEDGFSLLEREGGPVAWMVGRRRDDGAVAEAERKAEAAREDIDRPVRNSDCGPFPCSDYLGDAEDPKRNAYLLTLSEYEIQRLGALIRAWDSQEIERELEQARGQNTALQERLKEIVAHEAALERARAMADDRPPAVQTVASVER